TFLGTGGGGGLWGHDDFAGLPPDRGDGAGSFASFSGSSIRAWSRSVGGNALDCSAQRGPGGGNGGRACVRPRRWANGSTTFYGIWKPILELTSRSTDGGVASADFCVRHLAL